MTRSPEPTLVPRRLPGTAGDTGPGVVHAPGRAVAARVPGAPGRGQHPRRDPPARAGRRDHAPAGAPLRRRRRHPLHRHRGAGAGHRLRRRRRTRAPARWSTQPFRAEADLARLRPLEPEVDTPVRARDRAALVAGRARADVPLIGFAGAPFTVASYLVEGGPSRTYAPHQGADARRPGAVGASCSTASPTMAIASLRAQVEAGAQAVQLFDSWAGALSPPDYEPFVLPATRQASSTAWPTSACPASTSASAPASCWRSWPTPAPTWSGVDWRVPLDEARRRVGAGRGRAGQPRPGRAAWRRRAGRRRPGTATCCAATAAARATSSTSVTACCPSTDPAVLARVVDLVHARRTMTVVSERSRGAR